VRLQKGWSRVWDSNLWSSFIKGSARAVLVAFTPLPGMTMDSD
jgi:hypothetical protein